MKGIVTHYSFIAPIFSSNFKHLINNFKPLCARLLIEVSLLPDKEEVQNSTRAKKKKSNRGDYCDFQGYIVRHNMFLVYNII